MSEWRLDQHVRRPAGRARAPAPRRKAPGRASARAAATAPATARRRRAEPGPARAIACTRIEAPGSAATVRAVASTPSQPQRHQLEQRPLEAERHQQQADHAGRHDQEAGQRHGDQVGQHAVGRDRLEMEGGQRRGGGAGDQRGGGDADEIAQHSREPAPARLLRLPGAALPGLVDHHQGQHGREGELERGAEHALGPQQQHDQRRPGEQAQRERVAVDHRPRASATAVIRNERWVGTLAPERTR